MKMITVGIVGVSGYGGNELVRLVLGHPGFVLGYVGADSSAGKKLSDILPWVKPPDDLEIQKWDPEKLPSTIDLLFISLPAGQSKAAVGMISESTKIVDLGGDHRFVDGWTYGLADVWPEEIRGSSRVANPGCYPTAALLALAPLMDTAEIDLSRPIIVDAKSGVSGAGRGGGGSTSFGFAEVNEDVSAYKLTRHDHIPEMENALGILNGGDMTPVPMVFTPHLIPITRGILATCYVSYTGFEDSTEKCLHAARSFYENSPFVRVVDKPPHTKWASGSNLAFVSYAYDADAGIMKALCTIDNLGKGAAGQAVQNANLMSGNNATMGLEGAPLWP